MAVRVVIGCYNRLVAEALKRLLTPEREISIIGVFSGEMDSKEFFQLNPDVMLLGSKIFQALPKYFKLAPKTKILLIGDSSLNPPPPQWFDEFLSRGGAGILSPEADVRTLKEALNAVSRGEIWLDRKTMSEDYFAPGRWEERRRKTDRYRKGGGGPHLPRVQKQRDCPEAESQRTDRKIPL